MRAGQARILDMLATGQPLEKILVELIHVVERGGRGMIASILLMDADGRRLLHGAAPGLPDDYNRLVDGLEIGPRAGSCGTAAWRARRVVVEDIAQDPLWERFKDLARRHRLRACWSQPILSSDHRVLGTFAMYYRSPRGPKPPEIELILAAANLAGIAIERHRADERRAALERRLRAQSAVLVELAKSEELAREDFAAFVRLALERAATTLEVERAGVWFFDPDGSLLRCEDLYEATPRRHTKGLELEAERFPRYFSALAGGRVVAVRDARTDPATSEFREGYLEPLGIGSMLDAPLRRAGKLIGVVCHEHVGAPREWAAEESEFAASIAGFVALALETSERRKAEEGFRSAQGQLLLHEEQEKRLVEAELERVKGDLVRTTQLATIGQVAVSIAHELRNPLAAMRNAAYCVKRRVPTDDPKVALYLDIVDQEIQQADRIVSDLMDMSRTRDPEKVAVDLAQVLADAVEYLEGQGDLRIVVELTPDPFLVSADPAQLRQVFANLLTNSAQAMRGHGGITVRGWRENGCDLVTVVDEGPGVPQNLRRQVFEPLFTTKAKGTGLGLTICRQIVERHGGSIELAPSARGATFLVRLPRSARQE